MPTNGLTVHEYGYRTILFVILCYFVITFALPPFLPYESISSFFLPFIALQLAATLHLFSLSNALYSLSDSLNNLDLLAIGNRISDCGTDAGFNTALLTGSLLLWTFALNVQVRWEVWIAQDWVFAILFGFLIFSIHGFARALIRHKMYHNWFHGLEKEIEARRDLPNWVSSRPESKSKTSPAFSEFLNKEPPRLSNKRLHLFSSFCAILYYILVRNCIIPLLP